MTPDANQAKVSSSSLPLGTRPTDLRPGWLAAQGSPRDSSHMLEDGAGSDGRRVGAELERRPRPQRAIGLGARTCGSARHRRRGGRAAMVADSGSARQRRGDDDLHWPGAATVWCSFKKVGPGSCGRALSIRPPALRRPHRARRMRSSTALHQIGGRFIATISSRLRPKKIPTSAVSACRLIMPGPPFCRFREAQTAGGCDGILDIAGSAYHKDAGRSGQLRS